MAPTCVSGPRWIFDRTAVRHHLFQEARKTLSLSRIDSTKHDLAGRMVALRRTAHRMLGPVVADMICDQFAIARKQGLILRPDAVVSGFWPMGDEIDSRSLLDQLHREGFVCALPVVAGKEEPLVFRRWRPGDKLASAQMGLSEPMASSPEVEPTILLTSLLAVDRAGNRLGYGGGYYDRTLRAFRAQRPVTAVGIAFDAQIVTGVPRDAGDERLDWIVTEKQVIPLAGRTPG